MCIQTTVGWVDYGRGHGNGHGHLISLWSIWKVPCTLSMRNDFVAWHSMMSVCEIRGRGSSCRGLEWGEAIRNHLLLASGYGAWDRIGLIGMRSRVAGGKMGIWTAIMMWWASGIALPFFVGVHTFRRLGRR